jgi:hypothetical protein
LCVAYVLYFVVNFFLTYDSQGSPSPNIPILSPTTFIPPEPIQPESNTRKRKIVSHGRMSPVGCLPGPGPIENSVAQDVARNNTVDTTQEAQDDTFDPNGHNGAFHFPDYDDGDGDVLEEEEFFNSNNVVGLLLEMNFF